MTRNEALRYSDDYPIDVVIAWVDGNDPEWRKTKETARKLYGEKNNSQYMHVNSYNEADHVSEHTHVDSYNEAKASNTDARAVSDDTDENSSKCTHMQDNARSVSDDTDERYRDWETLRYLFRGIEKYMPWVRNVYLVTCGQKPSWLDESHHKLILVNHTDYIPAQYLPTFNSHAIELNFHRIKGLSEHFIYFNDDMFPMNPLDRHDFFIGGFPVDMLALQPVIANPSNEVMSHIYLNNSLAIARHYSKYDTMKRLRKEYFNMHYPVKYYVYNHLEKMFPMYTGFYTVHGASPLCKSTYEEVWEQEYDLLDATCSHPFRDENDVSQYMLREWKKQKGEFVPANVHKLTGYINMSNNIAPIVKAIKSTKHKMLCINDANEPIDFEKLKADLISAFNAKFPEKSTFEK